MTVVSVILPGALLVTLGYAIALIVIDIRRHGLTAHEERDHS